MRAVQMTEYGDADVLKIGEAPMPEPGEGEIRIRTGAVGVNPADWKWRAGWFQGGVKFTFPHIPGYDVAGVVDALGSGATGFAVGDRVTSMTPSLTQRAYAEYVVVPAASTAKIPDELDFPTAAALPTPGLTGVQLIEECVKPAAGETVVVTGAVGGVGRFSVYAARKLGARVVAAVRASQVEDARAAGADEVVVLGEEWTGGPIDVVADTVGGPEVSALCRHVRAGGRIGTVALTPIDKEGLAVEPVFLPYHADQARLGELARAAADRELLVPIARRFPLAEAAAAHRLVEAGGQGGKVVLEP